MLQEKVAGYAEYFAINSINMHIVPWAEAPLEFFTALFVYAIYLALAAVCYVYYKNQNSKKNILLAAIACGLALPLFHYVSTMITLLNPLSSLILTRSSQIIIILLTPFIMKSFAHYFRHEYFWIMRIFGAIIAVLTILLPSSQHLLALLLYLLALRYLKNNFLQSVLSLLCCLIALVNIGDFFPEAGYIFNAVIFEPLPNIFAAYYTKALWPIAIIALSLLIIMRFCRPAVLILFGLMYITTLWTNYLWCRNFDNNMNGIAKYEVQAWAKDNLPISANTLMMANNSAWISTTERSRTWLLKAHNLAVYYFPEKVKPHLIDVGKFISREFNVPEEIIFNKPFTNLCAKYLHLFSKDTYLAFAKDFNCDYVLVDSDKLLFDFPVIYQNDKYSVQQFK
jgi:hypothetical protein